MGKRRQWVQGKAGTETQMKDAERWIEPCGRKRGDAAREGALPPWGLTVQKGRRTHSQGVRKSRGEWLSQHREYRRASWRKAQKMVTVTQVRSGRGGG